MLGIKGVREAQFDSRRGELIVQYDKDQISLETIVQEMRKAGFDVSEKE